MKHNFLKKLMALLLGTIMVFSMIPAIAVSTKAAEVKGTKITTLDELTSGEYIIVSTAGYVLQKFDGGWVTVSALTNGSTVTTDSANVWTITVTGSSVKLTDSNGVSIAPTGTNANGIQSGSHNWQVSVSSGKFTFKGASGYTVTLACNKTSSYKVRAYKNTTASNATSYPSTFYLYKLEEACTHPDANNDCICDKACGYTYEHKWVDGDVLVPGDCTTDKVVEQVCSNENCNVKGENKTYPAVGHTDTNPADSKCDTCGTNLCTEHVWVKDEVVTEGNCTVDRVESQKCEICGEPGEDIVTKAPGHKEVVDAKVPATCTSTGKSEGSHCDVCGEVIKKQETLPMLDHNYVNDICTVCGAEKPVIPTFNKVTSTLDDFTGTYLIVYEGTKMAFNGSLTTLDAGKNGISVSLNSGVITGEYSAYTFEIKKTDDGKYTIMSASGYYIGQTAANSNGLLSSKTNQYKHTITIDANGNAVIATVGSSTTLRYNNNSGDTNLRFRYYKSGSGQSITLYKLVEKTPEPEVEAPAYKGFGLTLNKGVTVRVKFSITQEWLDANQNAMVTFSNGDSFPAEAGEKYYYTTLTPGQIGNDLTVTLGNITKTVSVSSYIEKAKAAYATDTKLCALLDAIDAYGKAAAKVEQSLTAPDFEAIDDYELEQNASIFTGFTDVTLGEYATIGLKVNAEEGYTFVASRGTATTGKLLLADHLENGALYIENIRPANFGDVITVTIYDGETVVSTIDFTFNSYLKLAYGEATTDLDRNIVIAAYNYGVAAAAYVNK